MAYSCHCGQTVCVCGQRFQSNSRCAGCCKTVCTCRPIPGPVLAPIYALPTPPKDEPVQVTIEKPVNPEVIAILERSLEEAKRGELTGILLLGDMAPDEPTDDPNKLYKARWSGSWDAMRRVGALERLKHLWLTEMQLQSYLEPE